MREQEMRLRALRFLKTRVRNMIMPATVGIGLAVGGCTDSSVRALYMAPISHDAGPDSAIISHDSATGPDSVGAPDSLGRDSQVQADTASNTPGADATAALDGAGGDTLVSEAGSRDVMADVGGMKYIAPFLDAAADAVFAKYIAPIPDAGADTMVAKYIAPIPDAAIDDKPAMRYLAQMPDADRVMPIYMAPPPADS